MAVWLIYVHLGHAESKEKLRTDFEEKLNVSGSALRIVCVQFTGKEGKTVENCPITKWMVRRREAALRSSSWW